MLPMSESLERYLDNLSSMELDSSTDSLLSDDIWDKFELEEPEATVLEDLEFYFPHNTGIVHTLLNHDCMWGGYCSHIEHPKARRPLDTPPLPEKAPVKVPQSQVPPGRSLLLKPPAKPVVSSSSPDSPPISDDEEIKGPTPTLKMLNDAINECELDEDSDLCEYFGDDGDLMVEDEPEEEEEEEKKPALPPPRPVFQPQIDHSYHKDKNASMRIANLGIETPSDSEEEIDVVSVGEKSRVGYGLPTNPSSQYQEHLERTVECAIGKRRPQGIKTLPPVRRYAVEASPKKRGVKRGRHGYGHSSHPSQSSPPYKRRAVPSNQCSDSDEPGLERRSLHNNMERQRRVDLRNAFEDLKKLVPRLSQIERAAKVQILQDSRDYCYHLTDVNENLQRKVHEMRRQQQRLHAKVSQLRRNLANQKKLEID